MSSPNTDLSKLGRVNRGDDIRGVARADRIMGLQDIAKSHVNGEPYSPSANLNRIIGPGWVIHRRRRVRTNQAGAARHPLQLYDASTVNATKVGITFGTVAGLVPDGWFDYISNPQYTPNPFILNVAGSGYVYGEVTITESTTIGVAQSLVFGAGTPIPPDAGDKVHLTLGTYIVSGTSVTVHSSLSGSQAMALVINGTGESLFLQPYWGLT
jgi:hypothetical protein